MSTPLRRKISVCLSAGESPYGDSTQTGSKTRRAARRVFSESGAFAFFDSYRLGA